MVEAYKKSADNTNIHQSSDFEATTPVLAGITFENINGSFPTDIRVSFIAKY